MYGLGAGAVEFIICHAEVSLAFVEEKKISEVHKFLSTTVLLTKFFFCDTLDNSAVECSNYEG